MAREYVTIGPTPCEEDCAQVGQDCYSLQARREHKAFIGQLRRVFGAEPEGAELAVKSFNHDFGSYSEVVCYYDEDNPQSVAYAFKCEAESPQTWDAVAQHELGLDGVAVAG